MRRTRIKICGVRRPEDALLAADAGADAIGMVFHPASMRNCAEDTAREIVRCLPPFVTPVALFMNSRLQHVRDVCARIGVATVQLHGDETPEFALALAPLAVIKTLRLSEAAAQRILAPWNSARRPANIRAILLETLGSAGGEGKENDWQMIHRLQQGGLLADQPAIVVAGGLRPGNVGRVVEMLHPWAVDVSSGVEQSRGEKSPALVMEFIQGVRDADALAEPR